MPNDKKSDSRRMVVEEVELPEKPQETKPSEEEKVEEKTVIEEAVVEKPEESKEKMEDEPTKAPATEPINSSETSTKQKSPVFWILIPGFLILGGILGGIIFYQNHTSLAETKSTPSPQASSVSNATPAPTKSPDVDVSEVDIAVYNGSGIAGEASTVKTLLEDAGFTVVSTGNAATYDYTKTIIKAKSEVDSAIVEKLRDTLSESYVVGEDQTLSSSSTTDIQVVVGSSKAE